MAATTLLISDLHLEPGRPEITAQFLKFLEGPARRAESLYILGDLFEVWLGDDAAGRLGEQIADALRSVSRQGTSVAFLAGNRDFLVGDTYCRRAGMTRLSEPVVLDLHGVPTVLMHGDTLCTDDRAYQRFRRKVRDPDWQARVLSRPHWWRRLLGRAIRTVSRVRGRNRPEAIMDVNDEAVTEAFRRHGVNRIIHGHTHRPAVHHVTVDGRPCERIVLGDWFEQGSVLRLDARDFELLALERPV